MTQWRKEHPKATWAEIEAAVDEQMNQVRAQLLQDLVQMGESEDWRQLPAEERPHVCDLRRAAVGAWESRRATSKRRGTSRQADAHLWHLPRLWGRLFSPSMSS